jgi:DNA mismatch repair protein MutS
LSRLPPGISPDSLTPALRQYLEAKDLCPDSFLFFQVGDFFELFFDDAVEVSSLLDLTLTSRQKIDGIPVPMCGVPLAAGDSYVNRLAAMGRKVSVCEQEPLPVPGEKVARRRLTKIVTPGTILPSEDSEAAGRFVTLALPYPPADGPPGAFGPGPGQAPGPSPAPGGGAAPREGGAWYLASADLSTGDFDLARGATLQDALTELARIAPKEILCLGDPPPGLREHAARNGAYLSQVRPCGDPLGELDAVFGNGAGAAALGPLAGGGPKEAAGDALGLAPGGAPRQAPWGAPGEGPGQGRPEAPEDDLFANPGAILAAGNLLAYLRGLAPGAGLAHLGRPRILWHGRHLGLDETAIRNLELFASLRDGGPSGTLLGLLDKASTPMGSRLLRAWLTRPLCERKAIEARHEAVEALIGQSLARDSIQGMLKGARDLERSMARISLGRGSIRDLLAVRAALRLAPRVQAILSELPGALLRGIAQALSPIPGLSNTLERSLLEASGPPPGSPEGAFLPEGLSPGLDELRDLESGGRKRIAELAAREKDRSGIGSLKVGYNRVFGYYLEVPKGQLPKVPAEWQRKQTLAGSERYVTAELLGWEERILEAGEKRLALEERILATLKRRVARDAPGIRALSLALSELDALASLAQVSQRNDWVRPTLTEDDLIRIEGGRHPVVEASLPRGESFVANDVSISQGERILVITGPNMSGKSTILRQTALIVILNQMGCFVPAGSALLSVRDHVFTRVGAADDLSRGRSTFMVEMSETARILQRATSRSLVILDEVGRGTSTLDGLAIAWAVAEFLHDRDGRGVPTLFATHYHELIELARHKPLAANYNVSVKKWEGRVVFLRKLRPGGTSKSYGIAVAALAGLPRKLIRRAGEVLSDLTLGQERGIRPAARPRGLFPDLDPAGPDPGPDPGPPGVGAHGGTTLPGEALGLLSELRALDPDTLTPLEGLSLLSRLSSRAKGLDL